MAEISAYEKAEAQRTVQHLKDTGKLETHPFKDFWIAKAESHPTFVNNQFTGFTSVPAKPTHAVSIQAVQTPEDIQAVQEQNIQVIPSTEALEKQGTNLKEWSVKAGYEFESVQNVQQQQQARPMGEIIPDQRLPTPQSRFQRPNELGTILDIGSAKPHDKDRLTFTRQQAFDTGLISKREFARAPRELSFFVDKGTTQGDIAQYSSTLKDKWGSQVTVSPGQRPIDKYSSLEQKQQNIVNIYRSNVGQSPIVKFSYAVNKDFFGMGTLQRYGVSMLRGSDWDAEVRENIAQYGYEIGGKDPLLYGAEITPMAIGKTTLFAAASKYKAVGLGLQGVYYGMVGIKGATTYSTVTSDRFTPGQKADAVAELFVMSIPAQIKVYSKGVSWVSAKLNKPSVNIDYGKEYQQFESIPGKTYDVQYSGSYSKVNVYQKTGFMQKANIKAPELIGKFNVKSGSVVKVGKDVFSGSGVNTVSGNIRGQTVNVRSESTLKGGFQNVDEFSIKGFQLSTSTSYGNIGKVQLYGKGYGGQFFKSTHQSSFKTDSGNVDVYSTSGRSADVSRFNKNPFNVRFGGSESTDVITTYKAPTPTFNIGSGGKGIHSTSTTPKVIQTPTTKSVISNIVESSTPTTSPSVPSLNIDKLSVTSIKPESTTSIDRIDIQQSKLTPSNFKTGTRSIKATSIRSVSKTATKQSNILKEVQSSSSREMVLTSQSYSTSTLSALKQSQAQATAMSSAYKQKQQQVVKTPTPSIIPSFTFSAPPSTPTPPPKTLFGGFSISGTFKPKSSITKRSKQITKYKPSLVGVFKGGTISKAPKLSSGIGIRYVLKPKKIKKKKIKRRSLLL